MKTSKNQILLGISSCALLLASVQALGSECFKIRHPDACNSGTAESAFPDFA